MASSKPILAALFLSSSHAEEGPWNQPEGVALILGSNLAMMRDAALEDALRETVEGTVGTPFH